MRVLSAPDAALEIAATVQRQPSLRMPLLDAFGHLLAEDVIAPIALPPWTNAGMDGYAARGDDVRGATADAPVRLRLTETIAAGARSAEPLRAGDAVRIFTGAAVPDGADSVIRQEDIDRDGDIVMVRRDRDVGANIRRAGGDLAAGALALHAGTVLGPHQLALLAALAVSHPVVHRRPRVGILTGGDEVVSLDHPDEILSGRRLGDANTPALIALTLESGGIPVALGIATDSAAEIERIVRAADDVDLLITAGGVSVGEHDHVRTVMAACGVKLVFDRVRMRPGGPTAFGVFADGRAWLALPGNPASAMVTFELFGRTAIRAMAGHRDPARREFRATLRDDVRPDLTLDQYLRCTFSWPAGEALPVATLTGPQGSGMLMSIAKADGLVVIPAGTDTVPAGTVVAATHFGANIAG